MAARAPLAALLGALAGVAVPLLLSAAVEVWWFDRPAAAHLRHAVHLLQTALHVTSEPNPDVPVLRPMTPRERYDTVVTYWMFGRGTDPQVATFAIGLAIALAIRWRLRSSAGLLLWLLAFAATTAGDVWEVVTAPKWLAGLVRVSPYVVCALFPFAPGAVAPRDRIERLLPAAVLATTAAYLVIAFAGVDTSGGKSLGPRLLLPLLPLLSVSALTIVASHLRSPVVVDRLVGYTGAALVAAAVVIHLGGPSRRTSSATRTMPRRCSRRRHRRNGLSWPTTCTRHSCCFRSTIARSCSLPTARRSGKLSVACWSSSACAAPC